MANGDNNDASISKQLEVTKQLAKSLQSISETVTDLSDEWSKQLKTMKEVSKIFEKIDKGDIKDTLKNVNKDMLSLSKMLDDIKESDDPFKDVSKALEGFNETAVTTITNTKELSESINSVGNVHLDATRQAFEDLHKEIDGLNSITAKVSAFFNARFPKSIAVTLASLSGFGQGFRSVIAMTKSSASVLYGIASTLFNVGAAIVSIPLRIMSGLVGLAAAAGGSNELAEAIEHVRKTFGDLKGPMSKTILDASMMLKGFSDTGLSTWRVFGNLAERINYVREVAEGMGATFELLIKNFQLAGGAIAGYQKGLGLSNEMMKGMGSLAISTGKDLTDVLNTVTKQTYQVARQFGMQEKVISRDVGKAVLDVKHFAGATIKEISNAAIYAHNRNIRCV
jgi:methyl-accepting chemotaxis protein